ncbi:hypothetical protein BPOR_0992g00020 [Botrytis porri]|uniref:Carboxylesterase type B domain-containing protein n=1 Tax=Botrytis porri TaxID=87229 RepID=A0A4Z1K6W3_9HELO|nr:hypothetical protein BPOR_0992g00020 [Botrytis porri]
MNVDPGHLIQTEEDMITSIKSLVHAMTTVQYAELFDLYPAPDFEEELTNYISQKFAEDPDISVSLFSRFPHLERLLFTCSSIDFGYHMIEWTQQTLNPTSTGVRLYDLNQSALTPLWKGAGMPCVKVSHGSDNDYLFNGVFPEGQLTEEDNEMSETMARSLVNFAYTGNPIKNTRLESFKVQVIGGHHGSGSVGLTDENGHGSTKRNLENESIGTWQQVLSSAEEFSLMSSAKEAERKRLIEGEKLFRQCRYINSWADTLDV